jgi:hypothetical protein
MKLPPTLSVHRAITDKIQMVTITKITDPYEPLEVEDSMGVKYTLVWSERLRHEMIKYARVKQLASLQEMVGVKIVPEEVKDRIHPCWRFE